MNSGIKEKYYYSIYWAFQTITTVGYGDFKVSNAYEILVTDFWIFIGVIFYSFAVGVMTSFAT